MTKHSEINNNGETIYEILKDKERSIAYVVITTESKLHYHKKTREEYYIAKGNGTIFLGELDKGKLDKIKVKEGSFIEILPNTLHKIRKDRGTLEFFVICTPAWNPDDHILKD